MTNKPLTPRKHHTFNENQSVYHKDSKNKLVLNNQTNKQQQQNGKNTNDPSKPHVDVIYFRKPLTRTGSTLITVGLYSCYPKPINLNYYYFLIDIKDVHGNCQKKEQKKEPKQFLATIQSPRF